MVPYNVLILAIDSHLSDLIPIELIFNFNSSGFKFDPLIQVPKYPIPLDQG